VQLYFKYESARKCHRTFQGKFPGEPVLSIQNILYLVNKLKPEGSLLDKQPDKKQTVLTEETLDDIGARLKTPPRKSLKPLMQETACMAHENLEVLREVYGDCVISHGLWPPYSPCDFICGEV
jgi:hypothetical protein